MGGDHAPGPELDAVAAILKDGKSEVAVTLVGDETQIAEGLAHRKVQPSDKLTIRHATQVVRMDDAPASAVKNKRDS